jgi:hypothetical protein
MITPEIVGYVVALFILFGAVWTLITQTGVVVAQFISMCLLALAVAIAPARVIDSFDVKQKNAILERELEEHKSTITSLNSKVAQLTAQNNLFAKSSLEKVQKLEDAVKYHPYKKDIIIDWTVEYKSWIGSSKKQE